MNKKIKKQIQVVNTKLTRLRQQLSGAKKQADDAAEIVRLQQQISDCEKQLEELKSQA